MFINGVNLIFFAFYIAAFWFYQPKRVCFFCTQFMSKNNFQKYLYGQLASVGLVLALLFQYVNSKPEADQPDSMGAIAAATQIASMAGGVYDLKRAFGWWLPIFISKLPN